MALYKRKLIVYQEMAPEHRSQKSGKGLAPFVFMHVKKDVLERFYLKKKELKF